MFRKTQLPSGITVLSEAMPERAFAVFGGVPRTWVPSDVPVRYTESPAALLPPPRRRAFVGEGPLGRARRSFLDSSNISVKGAQTGTSTNPHRQKTRKRRR